MVKCIDLAGFSGHAGSILFVRSIRLPFRDRSHATTMHVGQSSPFDHGQRHWTSEGVAGDVLKRDAQSHGWQHWVVPHHASRSAVGPCGPRSASEPKDITIVGTFLSFLCGFFWWSRGILLLQIQVHQAKVNPKSLPWTPLRWDWVFLERTRILSEIQFTRHSIEFIVVETKRFVSSNINVILTRHTCGQRSSMSTGSKHRALDNFFSFSRVHLLYVPNTKM